MVQGQGLAQETSQLDDVPPGHGMSGVEGGDKPSLVVAQVIGSEDEC